MFNSNQQWLLGDFRLLAYDFTQASSPAGREVKDFEYFTTVYSHSCPNNSGTSKTKHSGRKYLLQHSASFILQDLQIQQTRRSSNVGKSGLMKLRKKNVK